MLRIIDRYILREVIPPFLLSLLVLTFLLMIPPIMSVAEELIARGVDGLTILKLMGLLVPQALGITIPIGLLIGVLMGLGRLSTDREAVALQACGVSLYRMLYPLLVFGAAATAVTFYVLSVALPDANQAYRELTFRIIANRAEGQVKPRVFDDEYFPGVVLYVREVSDSGWSDVFMADTRKSTQPDVYVAERGRVLIDRESRRVEVILANGTRHEVDPAQPDTYEVQAFRELVISLDPDRVFRDVTMARGFREMTISLLRDEITRMVNAGAPPHAPIMELHKRFSIPAACLVFVIIGLGLGVTSRKDGKLASFMLGIGVVFSYYVFLYGGEAMTKGGLIPAELSMWLPNIAIGVVGAFLVVWRSSSIERRIGIPFLTRSNQPQPAPGDNGAGPLPEPASFRGAGIPRHLRWLNVNILDWYVTRVYLGIAGLAFVGLLGIFYISTFIDLADELFKGQATGRMLLEYFWFATPQFAYFVLPIAVLVSSLVTIGMLTKTSELTVMKACGISLYRAAFPIFVLSAVWSVALFGVGESMLARANRRAELLNKEIRSGAPQTTNILQRRWMVSGIGSIYHHLSFDPDIDEMGNLSVYDLEGRPWRLARRTFARHAKFLPETDSWEGHDVWVRGLDTDVTGDGQALVSSASRPLTFLEPPDFFETEPPDSELMNTRELGIYVEELRKSGFDVVELVVALHRKVSFPFVTVVLTLIAVPFAVTMGARGALYGVGVGIALSCSYWIVMSIFGAFGSAGLLTPILAAWAPNLVFGASATYLLLTVRT